MQIANEIRNEFFLLEKMFQYGFYMLPHSGNGTIFCINETDLKNYLKSINNKIEEIEGNHINHV